MRPGWRRVETWVCGGGAGVTRRLPITHTPMCTHVSVPLPTPSFQEVRKIASEGEGEAHEREKERPGTHVVRGLEYG